MLLNEPVTNLQSVEFPLFDIYFSNFNSVSLGASCFLVSGDDLVMGAKLKLSKYQQEMMLLLNMEEMQLMLTNSERADLLRSSGTAISSLIASTRCPTALSSSCLQRYLPSSDYY